MGVEKQRKEDCCSFGVFNVNFGRFLMKGETR